MKRRPADLLFCQRRKDMRMRKKKWAEPYLESHPDLVLADPSAMKGRWKELLGCTSLHVEIGMGKGGYIAAMVQKEPDDGWIGIERDRSAAAVAARHVIENGISQNHLRMIAGEAEQLEDWFEEGEVDLIHLNFSDPWPKKKTHKRRLSSEKFLLMYRRILADDGEIQMKTDNKDLFEDSVLYFSRDHWLFTSFSVDYRRTEHPEDAVTEYEQKFMDLGQPIYRLTAVPEAVK
jgi:tRNA (guanine-N7-)-methyltransferase